MLFSPFSVETEDCSLHRGTAATAAHRQHSSRLHIFKHRRISLAFFAFVSAEKGGHHRFRAARIYANAGFVGVVMRCHTHDVFVVVWNCYFQLAIAARAARQIGSVLCTPPELKIAIMLYSPFSCSFLETAQHGKSCTCRTIDHSAIFCCKSRSAFYIFV